MINELKDATSHFSFKAYEDSFRKIELDMDSFYKELLRVRETSEEKSRELAECKQKLGGDLLNFYKNLKPMTLEENLSLNDNLLWDDLNSIRNTTLSLLTVSQWENKKKTP